MNLWDVGGDMKDVFENELQIGDTVLFDITISNNKKVSREGYS